MLISNNPADTASWAMATTLIPLIRWITHTQAHVLSFKTDTVCMFVVLLIVKHLPVILRGLWATSDLLLKVSIFMCITFIGIITKKIFKEALLMLGSTPLTLFFIKPSVRRYFFSYWSTRRCFSVGTCTINLYRCIFCGVVSVFSYSILLLQLTPGCVTTYPGSGVGCNNGTPCIWHQIMNSVI